MSDPELRYEWSDPATATTPERKRQWAVSWADVVGARCCRSRVGAARGRAVVGDAEAAHLVGMSCHIHYTADGVPERVRGQARGRSIDSDRGSPTRPQDRGRCGRCEAQPMRSASETMIPSGPRT
jgi:hypothetical protein